MASNLPPGCTDRAIDEAAGVFRGPRIRRPDLRAKGRRKPPDRWRVEVPNGAGPDTEQTFSCLKDAFNYMAHALSHGRDTAVVCRLPEKPEYDAEPEFDTAIEEGCRFERAFGDGAE